MRNRAPAYWPTRILLAIGFIATVIALVVTIGLLAAGQALDADPPILGIPRNVVVGALGLVPVLAGFAWMVRIARGPRDEPPPWRHRDR